jgi:hypothetical protein
MRALAASAPWDVPGDLATAGLHGEPNVFKRTIDGVSIDMLRAPASRASRAASIAASILVVSMTRTRARCLSSPLTPQSTATLRRPVRRAAKLVDAGATAIRVKF